MASLGTHTNIEGLCSREVDPAPSLEEKAGIPWPWGPVCLELTCHVHRLGGRGWEHARWDPQDPLARPLDLLRDFHLPRPPQFPYLLRSKAGHPGGSCKAGSQWGKPRCPWFLCKPEGPSTTSPDWGLSRRQKVGESQLRIT